MSDDHRALLLARWRWQCAARQRASDRLALLEAHRAGRISDLDYETRVRVLQVQERHARDEARLLDRWSDELSMLVGESWLG